MSTPTTTTTTATPFGFSSLAHYFSAGITAVKSGLKFVETRAIPAIQKADQTAEVATSLLAAAGIPQASEALLVERAIDSAAGEFLAAVHTLDGVDETKPTVDLKISLDSYKTFKKLIADQKTNFASLGFKL